MPITPDTKNWTWVLDRPCNECGFHADRVTLATAPSLIRENAREWPAVLARADAADRPNEHTWSPLEYGAHVRDVHRLFTERVRLMLEQDAPTFPDFSGDAKAVADRYREQDPARVAAELQEAAEELARAYEAVRSEDADRTGHRGDGVDFTITTLAQYSVHDPVHHLWDVTRGAAGPRD